MSDQWLWEGEAGRLDARLLAPGFLFVTLSGRVDNYAVPTVEECLRTVGPIEGVDLYWDAYELVGVSNGFRSAATDLLFKHRKTIASIVTLTNSALIAMAVSTANLVLGGRIKGYRDREAFELAKRETAMRHGIDPTLMAG